MFERMARNNKLELTKANASANRLVCYSSASESFSQSVSQPVSCGRSISLSFPFEA